MNSKPEEDTLERSIEIKKNIKAEKENSQTKVYKPLPVATAPAYTDDVDPIVVLFLKWWKSLLLAVVFLICAIYIKTTFKETAKKRAEKASEDFFIVKEDLDRLKQSKNSLIEAQLKVEQSKVDAKEAASGEMPNIEEITANMNSIKDRLVQKIKVLGDGPNPYGELAKVYEAISFYEIGNIQESLKNLEGVSLETFSGGDLVSELSAYLKGKILVDTKGTFNEGVALLKALAKSGIYANVPSIILLYKVGDREEVLKLVDEVIALHPEQADVINENIKR
jgi:tetratricopeptide (TPR) repeat protein